MMHTRLKNIFVLPLMHILSHFLSYFSEFSLPALSSRLSVSVAFIKCPCIFLLSTLSSLYSLYPLSCCVLAIRMMLHCRNFRKGFHTLHKHLSRCLSYLKTKQKQNLRTTMCILILCTWCILDACLGILTYVRKSIVRLDARCLHSQQYFKFSDSGAHRSSVYNCFAVYIWIAEHHLACKKAIRMQGCGSTG